MHGKHHPPPRQTVVYGRPAGEEVLRALDAAGARRAALVTSGSLAKPGGLAHGLRAALGDRCAGMVPGIRAHTPREDVVRLAAVLRDSNADTVVGLGGGSVCDAIKAARLCVANGVFDVAGMDRLRATSNGQQLSPVLPSVMVPTTLSAGEFTCFAGVTDMRGPRKETFADPSCAPDVVVIDAAMALGTPSKLWAGTGMRAVDHAVEAWCSVNATPLSDASSLHALRLLIPGLLRWNSEPRSLEAILQCQVGAWLAIQGLACYVEMGASHGIGHALGGTAGMPHGETSCVMLPHVLRFNAPVNGERQVALSEAMGRPGVPAADVIAQLVAALGMPQRLRDAGIGRELLARVAAEALSDPWIATNPRQLNDEAGILELLEAAW